MIDIGFQVTYNDEELSGGGIYMIYSTDEKMRLFAENASSMRKGFFWDDSLINTLCASLYTAKGLIISTEKIKDANRIIKSNAGLFSNFRGFGAFGIGKKQRIMYSAILASQPRSVEGEATLDTAVVNSVTTMIIAQQAAMIAVIVATSASTAASSAAN